MKSKWIEWWQSLSATERFPLMKKHGINQVNDKLIKRMWNKEKSEIMTATEVLKDLEEARQEMVKKHLNGDFDIKANDVRSSFLSGLRENQ